MGMQRCTGLFALLFSVSFLSACGGDKAAEPIWLKDDATLTTSVAVLDSGTQLVNATDDYLRDADGEIIQIANLPLVQPPSIAFSVGDHFVLFGTSGQDVWRATLTEDGTLTSSTVIYSGTDISTPLVLKQFGDRHLVHWEDAGQFNWYSDNDLLGGLVPMALGDTAYQITPDLRLWYLDKATTELVELDLNTLSELSRTALDTDFLNIRSLYVNDGFVVGTLTTDLHIGVDLISQSRSTLVVEYVRSYGGYGTFKLGIAGQDEAGNLYYWYYAALAHSGFSTGMHIRAISNSTLEAWDYKVASGEPVISQNRFTLLNQGIQLTYVGETNPVLGTNIRQSFTSYYAHLNASGTALDHFHLQPHVVDIPLGYAGYPQLVELGYLADAFATTPQGDVYIYSHTGNATGVTTKRLAGRY